jgi:hypothetical protein
MLVVLGAREVKQMRSVDVVVALHERVHTLLECLYALDLLGYDRFVHIEHGDVSVLIDVGVKAFVDYDSVEHVCAETAGQLLQAIVVFYKVSESIKGFSCKF